MMELPNACRAPTPLWQRKAMSQMPREGPGVPERRSRRAACLATTPARVEINEDRVALTLGWSSRDTSRSAWSPGRTTCRPRDPSVPAAIAPLRRRCDSRWALPPFCASGYDKIGDCVNWRSHMAHRGWTSNFGRMLALISTLTISAAGCGASGTTPPFLSRDGAVDDGGGADWFGGTAFLTSDGSVPSDSSSGLDAAQDVATVTGDGAVQSDASVTQRDSSVQQDSSVQRDSSVQQDSPVTSCSQFDSESSCHTSCSCLWCNANGRCIAGTASGPTQETCNSWSYQCAQ
jgi:hypothetical protein